MAVVVGEVVGDAGDARMHQSTTEVLGRDDLAGRGLHERRATQEDRALLGDDDGLVRHRRDVRPSGGARSEHRRDLGDATGGELGLVVEDATEVLAIGEHVVPRRDEGTAGVDQVDAREPVLGRDLLRTQVLLHGDRVVRTALHRGVVGDDHAQSAGHRTDTRDDACRRCLAAVHPVRGERRQLEKRRAWVEQRIDPVTREQLPARHVTIARGWRSTSTSDRHLVAKTGDEVVESGGVHLECRVTAVEAGGELRKFHRWPEWPSQLSQR
jgi:hypothetical protein